MRAVIVFCEGNHDVVFVTRSLGAVAKGQWVDKAIRDLPSPFGPVLDPKNPAKPVIESVIASRYRSYSLENLSLRAAAHAPVPIFEALVEVPSDSTLYVLVRCNGDDAAALATQLIGDVASLMAITSDVKELAMAFIFDADEQGVAARERQFGQAYATCLPASNAAKHADWAVGPFGPVGLFVFHDATTLNGTLEEALAPLVGAEWPARWNDAGAYLTTHALPADPISTKAAERHKAQINVTGQFLFPGDPMTMVLGRKGLPAKHFTGPVSKALVDFLRAVPWK